MGFVTYVIHRVKNLKFRKCLYKIFGLILLTISSSQSVDNNIFSMTSLPNELLVNIMIKLDTKSLLMIEETCHQLRDFSFSSDREVWYKHENFDVINITDEITIQRNFEQFSSWRLASVILLKAQLSVHNFFYPDFKKSTQPSRSLLGMITNCFCPPRQQNVSLDIEHEDLIQLFKMNNTADAQDNLILFTKAYSGEKFIERFADLAEFYSNLKPITEIKIKGHPFVQTIPARFEPKIDMFALNIFTILNPNSFVTLVTCMDNYIAANSFDPNHRTAALQAVKELLSKEDNHRSNQTYQNFLEKFEIAYIVARLSNAYNYTDDDVVEKLYFLDKIGNSQALQHIFLAPMYEEKILDLELLTTAIVNNKHYDKVFINIIMIKFGLSKSTRQLPNNFEDILKLALSGNPWAQQAIRKKLSDTVTFSIKRELVTKLDLINTLYYYNLPTD